MKRTGDEQAKNDNLTVEELSIDFNFDDLDFSFDDFEINLDIDLDFLNEQKTNRRNEQRANKEKRNENAKSEAKRKP